MSPAELRAALKRAGDKPASCVIGLTKTRQAVILLDRLKKPRKLLGEAKAQAKTAGLDLDLASLRFGRVSVSGKEAGFTVNKAVAPAVQQAMKAPMRAAAHPSFTVNADPAIEDEPEDVEGEADWDDGGAGDPAGEGMTGVAEAGQRAPSQAPAAGAAPDGAAAGAASPPRAPLSAVVPPAVARGVAAAVAADPSRRPVLAGLLAQVRAGVDGGDPGAAERGVAALRQALDGPTPPLAEESRATKDRATSAGQPMPAPAAAPRPMQADATLADLARAWKAQQGQAGAAGPGGAGRQGGAKAPAPPASKSAMLAAPSGDADLTAPDGGAARLPPDDEGLVTPVLSREPWAPPGTVPGSRPPSGPGPVAPVLRGAARRGATSAVPRAAGLLGRNLGTLGRGLRWVGLRGAGLLALLIPDNINARTTTDEDVQGHPDLDGQVVQAPGSGSGTVRITQAGEGGGSARTLAELAMDPDGTLREGGWQGAVLGHVDLGAGTITLTPEGEAFLRRKAGEAGVALAPPAAGGPAGAGAGGEPRRPGTPGLPQAPSPGQEPQQPAWQRETNGIETHDDDEREFINGLAMGGMRHNDIVNALNERRRQGGTAQGGGPPGRTTRAPVSASPNSPPGPPYPGPDVIPMNRQERALVQRLLDQGKGEADVRRMLAERRARVGPAEARDRQKDDRNKGLPDEVCTSSWRARDNAVDGDPELHAPDTTRGGNPRLRISEEDFRAHHLIPMEMVRDYADLFRAAARSGWNPDEAANTIALPKDADAQARMGQAVGRQRPIHNSGHPNWNEEVRTEMEKLKEKLGGLSGDRYDQEVRRLLEDLQQSLRQRMLDSSHMPKLTQATPETAAA